MTWNAIVVEDDPEQMAVSLEIVSECGFRVLGFEDVLSVTEYLASTDELVDLLVLDRRLPVKKGETESDEVGDNLLARLRGQLPDARVVVFTGHSKVSHYRNSVRGAGLLPGPAGQALDRVVVLSKQDTIEFKTEIRDFAALLRSLDDVEVDATESGPLSKKELRAMRLLAFKFDAMAVKVWPLSEGLSGAKVWKCELRRSEGAVSRLVMKQVGGPVAVGGLHDLLPSRFVASSRFMLDGLLYGDCYVVLQLASADAQPLGKMIASSSAVAAAIVDELSVALDGVESRHEQVELMELLRPLYSWPNLEDTLRDLSMSIPSPTMAIHTQNGLRHGDFHPHNVLVDVGSPVVIDFDNGFRGAALIDPLALLIGSLTHPASEIFGEKWPSVEEIETQFGTARFGDTNPAAVWFQAVWRWIERRATGPRELWAVLLGYCVRALSFKAVQTDVAARDRVVALARLAVSRLGDS
jgi:CheY-like chemotaxis protein